MLVVTAEIWPGGDPRSRATIGELLIANESDLAATSSYSVELYQTGSPESGAKALQSRLVLNGHRRSDGVWALVRAILDQALSASDGC
jgi:hypothetical protein